MIVLHTECVIITVSSHLHVTNINSLIWSKKKKKPISNGVADLMRLAVYTSLNL